MKGVGKEKLNGEGGTNKESSKCFMVEDEEWREMRNWTLCMYCRERKMVCLCFSAKSYTQETRDCN